MIGHLADSIINITDTIFVGKLGKEKFGAAGLAGLYYYTFVLLLTGLAMGVQIIIGRRNGEKNYHGIGSITDNALITFGALGLFIFLLFKLITPWLLGQLIADKVIYEYAFSFASIRSYSVLILAFTYIFRSFYIGITQTRVIIFIAIGAALINVFFNQVLLFGRLGFPRMEIRGSATASVIAEGSALVGYVLYTIFRRANVKYNLFTFKNPDLDQIRSFLSMGFPIMLSSWISVSSWFVFFSFIEKMGALALAASALIKTIYVTMMVPVWGFGASANTLVSNAMGAERTFEVIPVVKKIAGLTLLLMFILVQVPLIFPGFFLSLLNSEPNVISTATGPLYMIIAGLLVFSVGCVTFQSVAGTGSTRVSLYIEIITLAVYFLYMTFCVVFYPKSLTVFWASELAYMISMLVCSSWYMRSGRWKAVKV